MFETLSIFPHLGFRAENRPRGQGKDRTLCLRAREASGTVDFNRVASSPDLAGARIRCLSGTSGSRSRATGKTGFSVPDSPWPSAGRAR